MLLNIPDIKTDSEILEKAYRIAAGDISGNITLFKSGLLKKEVPCILAGLDYDTPWTRDTAINVWNALDFFKKITYTHYVLLTISKGVIS